MMSGKRVCQLLAIGVVLGPMPAVAQSPTLTQQLSNLLVQRIVLAKTQAGVGIVAHDPIFQNDPTVLNVTSLTDAMGRQVGSQVSTFPLGSSSGGFTYAFDPALGTFSRSTETFGPAFAERAVTLGKGKSSFGMNYVHASYKAIDGLSLSDGSVKFDLLHQPLANGSYVSGDVIQAALDLKVSNDTTSFAVNYGATQKLDIGVAIPIVKVGMDLTYNGTILDFSTHASSPTTHVFSNGLKTQRFNSTGSASGVGDIVVLAKYNVMQQGSSGLAVAVNLTLPTGDADNMLGTGATLAKVSLIGSGSGRLAPHANVGFTAASGGTGVSNQLNYVGGAEYAVSPKMTLVADLVGRTLTSTTRFSPISVPHQFKQSDTAAVETTQLSTITSETGSLSTALGAVGVKLNPTGRLLISAHVLMPFTNGGLRSRPAPVLGFEYAF
ncbi:MAG: transporter [Vicinamibacterales bacterium]